MTNKPLRVLLWSPSGSGEHYSGPASFTYRMYSNAPKGELDITLVHGSPKQQQYPLFKSQTFLHDHSLSSWDQIKFIHKGKQWIKSHVGEFDVMHSISGYQYSIGPTYYAEKLGLPAAVFVSNHLEQLGMSGGWRKYIQLHKNRQRMARQITAMVSMSAAIKEELLSYGISEKRIVTIPMGVNTAVFKPAENLQEKRDLRKTYGMQEDLPTLLFVGTLVKRKRPDLLIKSLEILKKSGIDSQLVICGPETDAQYVKEMKAYVKQAGLESCVFWEGFQVDVSSYYRLADYFCLPSSNEGMAASLIEAMASALVPIVTPISGSTDVVTDGVNGRLVSADASEIASVIKDYALDTALATQHGRRSFELVQEKYTDVSVYRQYMKMYQRMAAGQAPNDAY